MGGVIGHCPGTAVGSQSGQDGDLPWHKSICKRLQQQRDRAVDVWIEVTRPWKSGWPAASFSRVFCVYYGNSPP